MGIHLGIGLAASHPLSLSSVTLFASGESPTTPVTDSIAYELGVKFSATVDGSVTALRYWRGAHEDDDTDVRTLRLWTVGGVQLASAVCTSLPGANGWQEVAITPVALTVGTLYIASYGTLDNYVASADYFITGHDGPGGILTSPSSASSNGVYGNGIGTFPTNSFNSMNYWVEPRFLPA